MTSSVPWLPAATHPILADDELHVWRASLDVDAAMLLQLEKKLNNIEMERAEKFLIPKAREYYVVARAILRGLLGAYVGVEPSNVEFSYRAQGKPFLSPSLNSKLCFNVSHSEGVALFAFAKASEVGVDIERVRRDFGGMEIASRFFSEDEVAALAKVPSELSDQAFFKCWTLKEAYVKAHGGGLSIPLREFTVDFTKRQQALLDTAAALWTCYALDPAEGFTGAVVVAGEEKKLSCLEWRAQTR